jgi:hypothetical protein
MFATLCVDEAIGIRRSFEQRAVCEPGAARAIAANGESCGRISESRAEYFEELRGISAIIHCLRLRPSISSE